MKYEFLVLRGVGVHKGLCGKFLCSLRSSFNILLMVAVIRIIIMCLVRKNDRSTGILSMLELVGNWALE